MDFHGIVAKGVLKDQIYTTPPTSAAASDEGRVIYVQSTNTLYFCDDTPQWIPLFGYQRIAVTGSTTLSAGEPVDTLTFTAGTGISLESSAPDTITITGANNFGNVASSGQTTIPAGSAGATLNIEAGAGITLTTVPGTKTLTITGDANSLNFFVTGRRLWLHQSTAPTGWTIATGCGDQLLAVAGGSTSYNVAGGTSGAGSWTLPTHTHTIADHSHYVALQSHYHTVSGYTGATGATQYWFGNAQVMGGTTADHVHYFNVNSGAAVGSGATTSGSGSLTTSSSPTDATYRPYANVGIIVVKT